VCGLSHVPVAVQNLSAAENDFKKLGFTLKPGRSHSDGIRNSHLKFEDGTEIELITASNSVDAITASYVDYLKRGDGPAFMALYAPNMSAVANALDRWSLRYEATDGLVSFPDDATTPEVFFAGLNYSPTDKPAYFKHANGAQSLMAVWLAGGDLSAEQELLGRLGASESSERLDLPSAVIAKAMRFKLGEVRFLPSKFVVVPGHPIVGVTVRTDDLRKVLTALRVADLPVPRIVTSDKGRSLFIPPERAHGMWIEFRETVSP